MFQRISLPLILVFGVTSVSATQFKVLVNFNDGGEVSGTFIANNTFTAMTAWAFVLSGSPTVSHNFLTPPGNVLIQFNPTFDCGPDAEEISFSNASQTANVALCLTTPLNASGATLDLSLTSSCGGGTCVNAGNGSIVPAPGEALVGYSANLAAGDSFVDLTNTGGFNGDELLGQICANVYVFSADQQMIACCTCPLTPNHVKSLSVLNDLVSNTLTPSIPNSISTMLVPSTGTCEPAFEKIAVPGLRAWGSTLHAAPGGGYAVTEVPYTSVPLSDTELNRLTTECAFIEANGSSYGVCGSCLEGAAGAHKR